VDVMSLFIVMSLQQNSGQQSLAELSSERTVTA
jgi:hypothetical protein